LLTYLLEVALQVGRPAATPDVRFSQLPMNLKTKRLFQAAAKAPVEAKIGVGALAALLWVFWPTLADMASRWGSESQYSHGYVVPVFAVALLWLRRGMLPKKLGGTAAWGFAVLLAGLGLRFLGTFLYFDWLTAVSLLPCLAGICLLAGGRKMLRWAWPAIGFLVFMVPLPYRLETGLAVPLQRLAARGSTYVLQTLGFTAFAEGNIIHLGDVRIDVVEACSGLSMLLIFFALSTAVVLVTNVSALEKGLILLSAIPFALLSNITRIVVTAALHKFVGSEFGEWFHDSFMAGLLVMCVGLTLLWIELWLFCFILEVPRSRNLAPFAFGGGGRQS
jgi:exosortase